MPLKKYRAILFSLLFSISCGSVYAENPDPSDTALISNPKDSADLYQEAIQNDSSLMGLDNATTDTVILEPALYQSGPDTVLINVYLSKDSVEVQTRSASLALLKSVLFPGWGQYSNRKYVKAGLIFAIESYFIYQAFKFGDKASDGRAKWKSAPEDLKSEYFRKYADFRDTRNSYYWYTGLTIFLSMFDAYVDAHLEKFPRSFPEPNKLSLDVRPGEETRVTLNYSFD